MQFKAKTEDDIKRESLLPAGDYDFQVVNAENKVSAKGNDMIALTLEVYAGESKRQVKDWIMEKMAFKLRHFCYGVGLNKSYDNGTLTAEECIGRCGKVRLVTQEDESGQYGPKNSVKDYLEGGASSKPAPQLAKASGPVDDGVPF